MKAFPSETRRCRKFPVVFYIAIIPIKAVCTSGSFSSSVLNPLSVMYLVGGKFWRLTVCLLEVEIQFCSVFSAES